jgi:hypothetical protein
MAAGEVTGPAEVNESTSATAGNRDAGASAPGEQRAAASPGAASPAVQNLLALLIYIAVFVIGYGLPVLRHLGVPQVGQDSVDPNFYIWSWRWWPYAVGHGLNPLHTTEVGAPGGYDLAWATTVPAASLALAPVTAAFGPVVSFNLTLLLSAPLSGWAVFLAARRLTGRFWAALLGGAVYGFSSFEVSHSFAGHFNLTVNMLPPLMLYLVLLWRDGKLGRAAFTGLLAIAMALQFYLFLEAFTAMTLLWAAALVIGYAVAGPPARRTVARLAGLAGIAYVLALVLVSPYLLYALRHYPANFVRYSSKYLLDPVNLVVPRPDRLFFLTPLTHYAQSVRGFSSAAYVGIPLLLVMILLAVTTWSSRITRLLVILFAVFLLIAIGPRLMINNTVLFSLPWSALWSLPIMHSAEPVRFFVVDFLVLAMILTLWLARPMRSRLGLASQWLLGLLSVAFILGNLPTASDVIVQPVRAGHVLSHTNALPAFMTGGLYRRYLRPGETVVVVSERGNAGMLFQADADFYLRIAGGFVNESLSTASGLPPAVVALRHDTPATREQFRAYVRRAGVSAVLVEQAWSARWMKVFAKMGLPAVRAGGVIIYDTTGGSGSGA